MSMEQALKDIIGIAQDAYATCRLTRIAKFAEDALLHGTVESRGAEFNASGDKDIDTALVANEKALRSPMTKHTGMGDELLPCPFCGKQVDAPFENLRDGTGDEDDVIKCWTIHHRGIDMWIEGGDKQECASEWNTRALTLPDPVAREIADEIAAYPIEYVSGQFGHIKIGQQQRDRIITLLRSASLTPERASDQPSGERVGCNCTPPNPECAYYKGGYCSMSPALPEEKAVAWIAERVDITPMTTTSEAIADRWRCVQGCKVTPLYTRPDNSAVVKALEEAHAKLKGPHFDSEGLLACANAYVILDAALSAHRSGT